ncbi:hypothetical protein KR222_010841 [Zaprionus bogoriensis]|nr:hypothetical protein KR222_010841 [Zaprionus bogoriensis]
MSTDSIVQTDSKMEIETTITESPVLNISGRDPNYRRAPRSKKKNKTKESTKVSNKFDYKQFPSILGGILLKNNTEVFTTGYRERYLGVLCLIRKNTNARVYHTFPTIEHEVGKDYDRVNAIYKGNKEFTVRNNITMQAICPRSLLRRAQDEFSEYKWNKEGNIFEAPPGHDEWITSSKLYDLHKKEVHKLFNFIRFLKNNK